MASQTYWTYLILLSQECALGQNALSPASYKLEHWEDVSREKTWGDGVPRLQTLKTAEEADGIFQKYTQARSERSKHKIRKGRKTA